VRSGALASWVRNHPLAAFTLWLFTIGWAIAFIPIVANLATGVDLPFEPFIMAATLLGLLLPVVAITWLLDGNAGLRDLGRRILIARVSPGWYLLALLVLPLISVAIALIFLGPPADATPVMLLQSVASGLLLQTVVGFITINLWEEVAWMGFFQARLQTRRGVVMAAVISAALFALQHLPIAAANGLAGVIVLFVVFVLAIPFRATLAWMYNRTGSLLVVGIFHAACDATGSGSFGPGLLAQWYAAGGTSFAAMLAAAAIGVIVLISIAKPHVRASNAGAGLFRSGTGQRLLRSARS
jgi:membrane protease YdiL (CAAX protease family)